MKKMVVLLLLSVLFIGAAAPMEDGDGEIENIELQKWEPFWPDDPECVEFDCNEDLDTGIQSKNVLTLGACSVLGAAVSGFITNKALEKLIEWAERKGYINFSEATGVKKFVINASKVAISLFGAYVGGMLSFAIVRHYICKAVFERRLALANDIVSKLKIFRRRIRYRDKYHNVFTGPIPEDVEVGEIIQVDPAFAVGEMFFDEEEFADMSRDEKLQAIDDFFVDDENAASFLSELSNRRVHFYKALCHMHHAAMLLPDRSDEVRGLYRDVVELDGEINPEVYSFIDVEEGE